MSPGMKLIPLSSSSGCGTGCSYKFGALFFIGLQVTMLIFLSASAPADIIPPELGDGLTVPEYFSQQLHMGFIAYLCSVIKLTFEINSFHIFDFHVRGRIGFSHGKTGPGFPLSYY
jgi:hypothetical protein